MNRLFKSLPKSRERIFYIVLLLAALVMAGTIEATYYINVLVQIIIWACAAMAWNVLAGYAGALSLGHAVFFGIGAYTSSILFVSHGVNPWLGIWIGVAISSVVALILGLICFRLKGAFLTLVTIAFAQLGLILATTWTTLTNGTVGITLPITKSWATFSLTKTQFAYVSIALIIIYYFICKYFERSKIGFYMMAYRENQDAARSLGVNIFAVKTLAFMISASMMSITGSFYAQYVRYIDPHCTIATSISIEIAIFAMIGGLGKAEGPILGALLMIPLKYALRSSLGGTLSGLYMIIYGVVLIIIVLYLPTGIAPQLTKILNKLGHKKATIKKSAEEE